MKDTILINASGNGKSWIGGLYYCKNIIFSLVQNENILSKHTIIVLTDKENENVFSSISNELIIVTVSGSNNFYQKVKKLLILIKLRVKYVYPADPKKLFDLLGITAISWIPDFQHNHLPEFFSEKMIADRTSNIMKIAKANNPLILSSKDSKNDFNKFYNEDRQNVYVVPFVSYIENEIRHLTFQKEVNVLNKYQLNDCRYVCTSNQFWKHKNHMVLFESIIKLLEMSPENNLVFVCTGAMEDNRHPNYIEELKRVANNDLIKDKIKILGFIEREEQIAIMKNASFIIQPSLFEGWGTVLEDSKVLNKYVILSDIPIHREQKNGNCFMFNPHNSKELASLILKVDEMTFKNRFEEGINKMYSQANEYSKKFEKLLNNN